jgi:DNA-binding PucR family transcriptional regulator
VSPSVVVGATYMGALVLSRHGDPDPVEARTLERAAQTAALLKLTQDAVVHAEERVRGELLTQLLTTARPFSTELVLRARARHIEPVDLDTVLVVEVADGCFGDATRLLHGLVEDHGGLAGEYLGIPTALLQAEDAAQAAQRVHQNIGRLLDAPALVCATPVQPGTEPLALGVSLASRCCRLLRGLGVQNGATTTDRLAMYAILFDPGREQDLEAFLDDSLGKLVAHDAERGTDLLGTLSAYFGHSRAIAGTARALHIHTNTLLKRIERINGLLGRGWQHPDSALRLQLAIHLHDLARLIDAAPNRSPRSAALRQRSH